MLRLHRRRPDHLYVPRQDHPYVVTKFEKALQNPDPIQKIQYQHLLQLIAGCAIVADHCFWITERGEKDNRTDLRSIQDGVELAIKTYQCYRQEAVTNAIVEAFPEPDLLPLSKDARKSLDEGMGKNKKESEFSKKINKELSERLLTVVLRHCLPKVPQPISEEASGSAT
ncbi:hypothetical protein FRB93_000123 [Tulasnella sp. JGI-2019a]|nr:hypothetical protein FRB93_000123 [Tulasnella sp. JGI-2019a]